MHPAFKKTEEIYEAESKLFLKEELKEFSKDKFVRHYRKSPDSFYRRKNYSPAPVRTEMHRLTPITSKLSHRFSPMLRHIQERRSKKTLKLNLQGLNRVIDSCNHVRSHKIMKQKVNTEQKIVRNWNRNIESTSKLLTDLSFCEASLIKKFYFLHKDVDQILKSELLKHADPIN